MQLTIYTLELSGYMMSTIGLFRIEHTVHVQTAYNTRDPSPENKKFQPLVFVGLTFLNAPKMLTKIFSCDRAITFVKNV